MNHLTFSFNNVHLNRSDFGNGLIDLVALNIAHISGVHCADKEEALKFLYSEAESLIQRVQSDNKHTSINRVNPCS